MRSTSLKILIFVLSVSLITSNEMFRSYQWIMTANGYTHTLGLRADGSLYSWGSNIAGQLGYSTKTQLEFNPKPVMEKETFRFVAAKGFVSFAITSDGRLFAWGNNLNLQLGIASKIDQVEYPVQVGKDSDWSMVAPSDSHTLALKENGKLYGWGLGYCNKNGNPQAKEVGIPAPIFPTFTLSFIAAADHHSFFITRDDELYAWGNNKNGQLGDGSTVNQASPVRIGGSTKFLTIAAGDTHTLAIDLDHNIYAWGSNDYGQVGLPLATKTANTPQTPVALKGKKWDSVAAGRGFSILINEDKTVWGFGNNWIGQLGGGKRTNFTAPIQTITEQMGSLSAGQEFAFGVTRKGAIMGWGDNSCGQLGNGEQQIKWESKQPKEEGGLMSWLLKPFKRLLVARLRKH